MKNRAAAVVATGVLLGGVAAEWLASRPHAHPESPPAPVARTRPSAGQGQAPATGGVGHNSAPVASPQNPSVGTPSVGYVRKNVSPPDTKFCASDLDCPAKHACLLEYRTNTNHCLREDCSEDSDCTQGNVCRVVNASDARPPLKRCIIAGNRLEGESCSIWPNGPEGACDEYLVCAHGRCGRPCTPSGPNTCPPAFACAQLDTSGVASCVPDCRKQGCPEGRACVLIASVMALCLELANDDCRRPESACPTGQICDMTYSRDSVLFHCDRPCSPFDSASCAENEVCGALGGTSTCMQRCQPGGANTCAQNYRCAYADEAHQVFACRPSPISRAAQRPLANAPGQ